MAVVANAGTHIISVYSLTKGSLLAEFGGFGDGPCQFKEPRKICFSSRSDGSILIADGNNKRVQV